MTLKFIGRTPCSVSRGDLDIDCEEANSPAMRLDPRDHVMTDHQGSASKTATLTKVVVHTATNAVNMFTRLQSAETAMADRYPTSSRAVPCEWKPTRDHRYMMGAIHNGNHLANKETDQKIEAGNDTVVWAGSKVEPYTLALIKHGRELG